MEEYIDNGTLCVGKKQMQVLNGKQEFQLKLPKCDEFI